MISPRLILFSTIPLFVGVLLINKTHISISPLFKEYQQTTDSADIIINKYISAVGGKAKLDSIHSIYMEGVALGRGQKFKSKTWIVNNMASKSETFIGGFTSWTILRTDSAWSFNPRRGQKLPDPWPSERVKAAKPGLDIAGSLVDYTKKGYKAEYKGIEQIEGSDTYKIEVILNLNVTKTYYIDLDSYLILRERTKTTTKARVNYSSTDYSNYQKTADGYTFPMEIGNVKYTTIKVNPPISDTQFIPTK